MKALSIIAAILVVLSLTFVYMLNDRDRSMWLLNSAVKLANPHPVLADISYGDKEWQKLDVYPSQNPDAAPVVIFIHGGSWRHGRKDQYRFAADAFIRKGYTVVLPDYVKHPDEQAKFPSFATDAALAVKWVKDNIQTFNGDPEKLFLAGHSAGAHTVAILTTDSQYLQQVGLSEADISGVAGIAGPYSFIPDWEVTKAVFGPPARYPLMDVFNYVDGNEPPTILLHSSSDQQVGQYNSDGYYDRLVANNVKAEKVIYQQPSHIDMVTMLHPWFVKQDDVASDIDRFFRSLM
ncbi:MAG: alpha/beta hydrolase [Gammaproteobacteria bacterium]|nr:alpha/beta hydrolase [Gammaproteobacteria bacterium]